MPPNSLVLGLVSQHHSVRDYHGTSPWLIYTGLKDWSQAVGYGHAPNGAVVALPGIEPGFSG